MLLYWVKFILAGVNVEADLQGNFIHASKARDTIFLPHCINNDQCKEGKGRIRQSNVYNVFPLITVSGITY